jgi:hypothetical protein
MTKHKTGTHEERLAAWLLAIATTAGDVVATVYKDSSGSALYVEPLPPQSLTCKKP